MRLLANPNEMQREAAIKIKSGTDALIWLGGFLDLVCCPCFCVCAFFVMGAAATATAAMAEQPHQKFISHIERIPQVKRIVGIRKKDFDPKDPKM